MRFPECLLKVRRTALLAVLAALAVSADEAPWNTYIVDRTVEVSPGARKNKAFPMEEGSALCDLHLRAEAPWRIRSSRIALRDDKTLWFKASDREYIIASGYAPNEYVVVRGELEKSGGGSGKGAEERPQFQVTVPKVDLQWAAKHGEASEEEKEDSVPAVIMVSESPEDFGTLVVSAPKDDFQLSDPRVTLTWTNPDAVKVFRGNLEVGSGVSWLLMAGTQLELSVKAVRPEADVKFTLKGEPDVVSHERAVDYVRACCCLIVSRAVAEFPENRSRSFFGVGEIVDFYIEPRIDVEWSTSIGSISPATPASTARLILSDKSGLLIVSAKAYGCRLNRKFQVLEPQGYASAAIEENVSYPAGTVAGVLIIYPIVIGPVDVSFSRVEIKEVGSAATEVFGSFSDHPPPIHQPARGWTRISENGNRIRDIAGISGVEQIYYLDQRNGFVIQIPVRWRVIGTQQEHNLGTGWSQSVEIDRQGTVTVRKFGVWGSRTIDNWRMPM